jgi:hypothetical protein
MRWQADIHSLLEPEQGLSRLDRVRHPRATMLALMIQSLGLLLLASMAWLLLLYGQG